MLKWKKEINGIGGINHNLYLSHHYQKEELVATLFKGEVTGDWLYTSLITNSTYDFVADSECCEHDAKLLIQEKIYSHYEGERNYYQEILVSLDILDN